ncbi:ketopantoate reductase family protein [Pseudoalteromonas sp. S16_S37]|uniref:ketopantoate reductase family protein n=1 Tax=Pseudoalteromonas sp. S16_S37 TaxID=2720228 RepID=UPI0016818BCF|nr:ketopantoate reductase family protein [Pseudoalteromonas sp. S16_S37]MBD1582071.1 ketopantoate reductase family protein [Pseudoalteromonas sp. S16_S37]
MSKVHILGAGAIGLTFAHALSQQHDVTIISRNENCREWLYTEQNTSVIRAKTLSIAQAQSTHQKIDNCFVCVKSYQLKQALTDVLPLLSDTANLIISHNGMQDLTTLSEQLGPNQALYFASTAKGALKLSNNHVKATGLGDTFLGACNTPAKSKIEQTYQDFFATLLAPSFIHDDINLLRWQKLAVNIAINPLSAIHQIPNGQLRQPRYASTILALLNETCAVAKCEGVDLPLSQALDSAYQVMTRTQHNFSSMAQDVKLRRKTEIDAICGYIVALGKKHHIATPMNASLLHTISDKH